nr:MAG TPA: hypothetical protein [Caudoviricetes sp.]
MQPARFLSIRFKLLVILYSDISQYVRLLVLGVLSLHECRREPRSDSPSAKIV